MYGTTAISTSMDNIYCFSCSNVVLGFYDCLVMEGVNIWIMVQREYIVREVKVETLRRIVNDCSEENLPALKSRLIAYCGKEWGTEHRKVLEYLNQLIAEESIFIDNDDVWTLKRWLKIEKARKLDYLKMQDIINGRI